MTPVAFSRRPSLYACDGTRGLRRRTVEGTTVLADGQPLMTLSDGELDRPVNDWFGAHVNRLLKVARGDTRTLVKNVLRRIIRYAKRRGFTWVQFRDYCQTIWNATTTDGD